MKLRSLITLLIFLNFTALPSLAAVFDWNFQQMNVVLNEEENHGFSTICLEKAVPKTIDVHEFIKFFEGDTHPKNFITWSENTLRSPYISITSPPPEA